MSPDAEPTLRRSRLSVPVQVHACERRVPYDIETAVYFCCVEVQQNAAKHSFAGQAWISLDKIDGRCKLGPVSCASGRRAAPRLLQ
jgi:signal transduction histidine kinase